MRIWWGDGHYSLLTRLNGPTGIANVSYPNGDPYPNGEPICNYNFSVYPPAPLVDARKINIYQGTWTYDGPGTYHLWMDDPDRMANINNVTGSVNVDFYLFTTIVANEFTSGCVNSPVIANAPVCQYACAGECYTYNPGAYIPTPPSDANDSIVYSLGHSLALNPLNLQPEVCPGNNLIVPIGTTVEVDQHTGTLKWCNAQAGIWNFVILMTTMRRTYSIIGTDTTREIVPVDTVELELEVIVNGSCAFNPPSITSKDTCVVAGGDVQIKYTANAGANNLQLYITDAGEPFSLSPPAVLTGYAPPRSAMNPVFNWTTTCAEVRANPYSVVIKATEKVIGGGLPPDTNYYSAYGTSQITVIGPAPPYLFANLEGTTICLNWEPSPCAQAIGYNIYRHIGCSSWKHGYCETGVPAYTGYTLLATVYGIDDTTYCDSNGGAGLSPGVSYSYVVDAIYPLSAASHSYASIDTCVLIKLGVPLITNVSVTKTGQNSGEIFVRWMKPIADADNLDTNTYPGPYEYILSHATSMNSRIFTPAATFTSAVFKTKVDTTYLDKGLDTQDSSYNYKIDFYYTDPITKKLKDVGPSGTASSTYLRLQRGDASMRLGWSAKVPWTNDTNFIYRLDPPPASTYKLIGKTGSTSYTDTGLSNGYTYCYYVKSSNHYGDTNIKHPLYDSSETVCGVPQDTIAPCSPQFDVKAKCTLYEDSIIWSNPNRLCPRANKVVSYNVFYSPTLNGDEVVIATINAITNPNDTLYVNGNLSSVAGCYEVVAYDSAGQASIPVKVCVDNCPDYQLPNVFSPNGDNVNDLFMPLIPYRYVKSIDINIYNRWGQVLFHTTDPQINWNGNVNNSGGKCPDGVYYYICVVNEIRLEGIVPVTLKGFIQLIR